MNGQKCYPIFIEGALQPATLIIFWIKLFKSISVTLICRKHGGASYHSSLGLPRSLFPPKFPINTPTTESQTAPPQDKTDNTLYIFRVILVQRTQNVPTIVRVMSVTLPSWSDREIVTSSTEVAFQARKDNSDFKGGNRVREWVYFIPVCPCPY
jgi:hypothetical protein